MLIKIDGSFKEEDLKIIAKALREIERKDPEGIYMMLIEDRKMSLKRAVDFVTKTYDSVKLEEDT